MSREGIYLGCPRGVCVTYVVVVSSLFGAILARATDHRGQLALVPVREKQHTLAHLQEEEKEEKEDEDEVEDDDDDDDGDKEGGRGRGVFVLVMRRWAAVPTTCFHTENSTHSHTNYYIAHSLTHLSISACSPALLVVVGDALGQRVVDHISDYG